MLKNFLNKILNVIRLSTSLKEKIYSTTRVSSYIILLAIIWMTCYFIIAGLYILIVDKAQDIPNSLLVIYGMLLAHHLTLLGINKYHENKNPKADV